MHLNHVFQTLELYTGLDRSGNLDAEQFNTKLSMSLIQILIQEKLIQERLNQAFIEAGIDDENVVCITLDSQTSTDLAKIAKLLNTDRESLAATLITSAVVEFNQNSDQTLIKDDSKEEYEEEVDLELEYSLGDDEDEDLLTPSPNYQPQPYHGDAITRKTAAQAFVKAITQLNIKKVRKLNEKCNKIDLISTRKLHESQYPVGKYWIMTHMSTNDKKILLERIANKLGKKIKVEVI